MTIPTLHDDRIDMMRQNVMQRVDHDIKRRGKRARMVVGLASRSAVASTIVPSPAPAATPRHR